MIEATPTVITPHDDEAPEQMFERARGLLIMNRGADAARLFDRLAEQGGRLTPLARFNAGIGWEQAGDRATALLRFRAAAVLAPTGEAGKWARLRQARIEGYTEQWTELAATADILIARTDLTQVEQLEAWGDKALALVESGDPDGALRFIAKGRDIIEALHLGDGGKLPLEVAQIDFALGEVRKLRSEAIVFVPLPPNFAGALEQRCQGLLDAQSAYSDAMRSYDAHWAAMSGFRVGELYQRLHRDVLSMPVPAAADTVEKKRLFEGAMRLRYRVLLEKGLTMMEHTTMVADRTGEASAWIERARSAKHAIQAALSETQGALSKLPYSEKELQKAMDDLAKKAP